MARKPKNANIDIRQTARVFYEQAFVDGVFNDDHILTRKRWMDSFDDWTDWNSDNF